MLAFFSRILMTLLIALPVIIAYRKKAPKLPVFLCAIFSFIVYQVGYIYILFYQSYGPLGFYAVSFVLWVFALKFSFAEAKKLILPANYVPFTTPKSNVADELGKLFALKEKGAITEEEYKAMKEKIMK